MVMNAARIGGGDGGYRAARQGTGSEEEAKFYKVSIAQEKEVIMIVARAEQKAAIMQAILRKAGPDSEAGTIVFSLPVSEVAGLWHVLTRSDNRYDSRLCRGKRAKKQKQRIRKGIRCFSLCFGECPGTCAPELSYEKYISSSASTFKMITGKCVNCVNKK